MAFVRFGEIALGPSLTCFAGAPHVISQYGTERAHAMPPLFSICIPNFNYAKYVGTTIESVLSQDEQDFEIIVADNASTDDSVTVVEKLKERSSKIRLVRNRANVGFPRNLDRAARPAAGRFMLMLSSDDVMNPGALTAYRKVIDALGPQAERAVIASAWNTIDSDGKIVGRGTIPAYYPSIPLTPPLAIPGRVFRGKDMAAISLPRHDSPLPFLSTMYSRALYEEVEGYWGPLNVGPDYHFVIELLKRDPTVVYLDRELFSYRIHPANQLTAATSAAGPLKFEVDRYLNTLEYNSGTAAATGFDHQRMLDAFVDTVCMETGASHLSRGAWVRAFRLFALAWAMYPQVAVRRTRTYGMAGLLALGPLGIPAAKLVKALRGRGGQ